MNEYQTVSTVTSGAVVTVTLLSNERPAKGKPVAAPWEIASLFNELREDDSVRVIVLTGENGQFKVPPAKEYYESGTAAKHLNDPVRTWHGAAGVVRCHQVMAEIEKPIVAKVNGDAIGLGQSLVFACDLIIARQDARFMDHHMGPSFSFIRDGQTKEGGHDYSIVPGDGGAALIPLFMTPVKAKEYLMLSQAYTAEELEKLGIINYAVPADELDRKVDEIVEKLLQKGAYALAWTKRVANRRVVDHLNLTLDAATAYERVNYLQLELLGGVEKKSLD